MIGGLSPEARALLRAAQSDSPPSAARAAIWNGVEQSALPSPSGPTSAAPLPVAAPAAAPVAVAAAVTVAGSMKAAFVGAILGSVLSAGITVALLSPVHSHATEPLQVPAMSFALLAPVPSPVAAPAVDPASVISPAAPSAPAIVLSAKPAPHDKTHDGSGQDSLSREVALVAEARGELLRGDATRALATIRVARSLKVRQLEPEELALEVRALRALDRTEEADRVDAKLRADFPEHALAR